MSTGSGLKNFDSMISICQEYLFIYPPALIYQTVFNLKI